MEKWLKKIKRLPKNKQYEELLQAIRRGGVRSITTAEVIVTEKGFLTKEVIKCILLNVKTKGIREREATRLREQAAKKGIKRKFLDENLFLLIENSIDQSEILLEAAEKFLDKTQKPSNYALKRIIRRVPALRKKAAEILLKQTRSTDDLLPIVEELRGSLQKGALDKIWEMGMPPEDFTWLVGFELKPSLAWETWKRGKKENILQGLPIKDLLVNLYEIAKYTKSQKVKSSALDEMYLKKEDLNREQREFVHKNVDLITIGEPEKVKAWKNKPYLRSNSNVEKILQPKPRTNLLTLKLEAREKMLSSTQEEIENLENSFKEETKRTKQKAPYSNKPT